MGYNQKIGKNCKNINKIRADEFSRLDIKTQDAIKKKFHNYYSAIWAKLEPIMGGIYGEDHSGFKDFVFYLLSKGQEKLNRFLLVDYNKYFFKDFSKFNVEYRIKQKLFEEKSPHQLVQVFKTKEFGNMLVIDNDVQLTEADESNYHEMIAHVPLLHEQYHHLLLQQLVL